MKTLAPAQTEQVRQSVKKSPARSGGAMFLDKRESAVTQRKLQKMIDGSPRTMQLKAAQEIVGHSAYALPVKDEAPLQGKFSSATAAQSAAKQNNTGLPNQLKAGIESLSGMTLDHVKVHYNSAQPAQLNAHAYAQGSEIHLAPGQERHLPHEAWHVVQQAQGRVKPTMQMKGGVPVNDDVGLEQEADAMGEKALQKMANGGHGHVVPASPLERAHTTMPVHYASPIQRAIQLVKLVRDRLNVAGEQHPESDGRRVREQQVSLAKTGSANYWREGQFAKAPNSSKPADPYELRYEHILKFGLTLPISTFAAIKKDEYLGSLMYGDVGQINAIQDAMASFYADDLETYGQAIEMYGEHTMRAVWIAGLRRVILHHCSQAKILVKQFEQESTTKEELFSSVDHTKMEGLVRGSKPLDKSLSEIIEGLDEMHKALIKANTDFNLSARDISAERSGAMHASAQTRAGEKGVWKVGEEHAGDMAAMGGRHYNVLSRDDFNAELL